MKAFSLLVCTYGFKSLGGNGNVSMNLHEKAIDTDRPNGWYYVTSRKTRQPFSRTDSIYQGICCR